MLCNAEGETTAQRRLRGGERISCLECRLRTWSERHVLVCCKILSHSLAPFLRPQGSEQDDYFPIRQARQRLILWSQYCGPVHLCKPTELVTSRSLSEHPSPTRVVSSTCHTRLGYSRDQSWEKNQAVPFNPQ